MSMTASSNHEVMLPCGDFRAPSEEDKTSTTTAVKKGTVNIGKLDTCHAEVCSIFQVDSYEVNTAASGSTSSQVWY